MGYWQLVSTNADYRRVWLAEIASHLGDWFNTIALYTLVQELTGSSLALGLVFITKMLPFAVISPFAGLITDRLPRKHLMIATDLARAVVVLGLLSVDSAAELPRMYALVVAQVMLSAVFIPARSASIPNITTPRELLTANALSSATWSTLLALGAALGGFATDALGVQAVFVLDSVTYLVSALLLLRATIPQTTDTSQATVRQAVADILDGWRQLRRRPAIGRMVLTKPAWAAAGSALVYMLALLGEEVSPAAPAVGIGLLFAARGLGTGLGPILARNLLPDRRRWPAMMGWGIFASGIGYMAVALGPRGWLLALPVLLAHAPSGANWVLSTVLLQERTEDRYRGRVFATEWLILTATNTLGILAASLILEWRLLTLVQAMMLFGSMMLVSGVAWLLVIVPRERRQAPRDEAHQEGS